MGDVAPIQRRRDQGERLKQLREWLDIRKSRIAVGMHWSSTQTYDLYEKGTSAIRLDEIDTWAAAFGITPEQFGAVLLGTLEPTAIPRPGNPEPGAILREKLTGRVEEHTIERLCREHADADAKSQHEIADEALAMTADKRARASDRARPPLPARRPA